MRNRRYDLAEDLGTDEADDVRAAVAGARESLSNALESLRMVWDAADVDLARIGLMVEDLYTIERGPLA